MKRAWLGLLLVLVLFSPVLIGAKGDVEHYQESIPDDGATQLDMTIDFGAGDIRISPGNPTGVALIDIDYEPDVVRYRIDQSSKGNTKHLQLTAEPRRRTWKSGTTNDWDITLSRTRRLTGDFELGACDAEIDLGGIPITELSFEVGAASGELRFSAPNPERIRELKIEVGASSMDIRQLGNARIDQLDIECGAGSLEIDFTGEFSGETEAHIEVGVSSVDIVIPRGLAVRVEGEDNIFSSIDLPKRTFDEVDDNVFETDNFSTARDKLILVLEVGMGSVDIRLE